MSRSPNHSKLKFCCAGTLVNHVLRANQWWLVNRGRMRQDKIQGLVPPDLDSYNGDLGMGCRNLFLEISILSGCLRVRYPKLMCRCGHRGQTPWISFQTCCSDMSRPVSQNHTCLRPQAPRDSFSCGVRPPGFYGDKILGLTLPCMSNPYLVSFKTSSQQTRVRQ